MLSYKRFSLNSSFNTSLNSPQRSLLQSTENISSPINNTEATPANLLLKRAHPESLIVSGSPMKIFKQDSPDTEQHSSQPEIRQEDKLCSDDIVINELNEEITSCELELKQSESNIEQHYQTIADSKQEIFLMQSKRQLLNSYCKQLDEIQLEVREQCNWIWSHNEDWRKGLGSQIAEAKKTHDKRFEKLRLLCQSHMDNIARAVNEKIKTLELQIENNHRTIQTVKESNLANEEVQILDDENTIEEIICDNGLAGIGEDGADLELEQSGRTDHADESTEESCPEGSGESELQCAQKIPVPKK